MKTQIQIIKSIEEKSIPFVKLTKSKNGKTGTATFIFIKPTLFITQIFDLPSINGMFLIWENKQISTRDISVIFQEGKPYLIKAIFLFKNKVEWFQFLSFMSSYSNERGLFFSEKF